VAAAATRRPVPPADARRHVTAHSHAVGGDEEAARVRPSGRTGVGRSHVRPVSPGRSHGGPLGLHAIRDTLRVAGPDRSWLAAHLWMNATLHQAWGMMAKPSGMMPKGPGRSVHVALLRGVNVGGKNRLPMQDLAAMFRAAGCDSVRTFIQSGNVVFSAEAALAARISTVIAKAIATRCGFTAPVVVRRAEEMARLARHNPYLEAGADPKTLHVVFLLDTPAAARVATLDARRSPPDDFVVRGREIFLRCPNGVGRSKLTVAYFDSRLATTSTARNWNTVLKLAAMARSEA
jgi:uncharacterized protein (DUF1697 family)